MDFPKAKWPVSGRTLNKGVICALPFGGLGCLINYSPFLSVSFKQFEKYSKDSNGNQPRYSLITDKVGLENSQVLVTSFSETKTYIGP